MQITLTDYSSVTLSSQRSPLCPAEIQESRSVLTINAGQRSVREDARNNVHVVGGFPEGREDVQGRSPRVSQEPEVLREGLVLCRLEVAVVVVPGEVVGRVFL